VLFPLGAVKYRQLMGYMRLVTALIDHRADWHTSKQKTKALNLNFTWKIIFPRVAISFD
jgi:hypothetical protein